MFAIHSSISCLSYCSSIFWVGFFHCCCCFCWSDIHSTDILGLALVVPLTVPYWLWLLLITVLTCTWYLLLNWMILLCLLLFTCLYCLPLFTWFPPMWRLIMEAILFSPDFFCLILSHLVDFSLDIHRWTYLCWLLTIFLNVHKWLNILVLSF